MRPGVRVVVPDARIKRGADAGLRDGGLLDPVDAVVEGHGLGAGGEVREVPVELAAAEVRRGRDVRLRRWRRCEGDGDPEENPEDGCDALHGVLPGQGGMDPSCR
jgi:hypothetical protein